MKTSAVALGAFAAFVAAQDASSVPECGQFCANDMLTNKGGELDCENNDLACLCQNENFIYGLRDCSAATCGGEQAREVVNFGIQACRDAGVEITDDMDDDSTGSESTVLSTTTTGGTAIVSPISTVTSSSEVVTVTSGTSTTTTGTDTMSPTPSETNGGDGGGDDNDDDSNGGGSGGGNGGDNGGDGGDGEGDDDSAAMRLSLAPVGVIVAAGIAALML